MQSAGLQGNKMTYAALCQVFQKQGRWDKYRTAMQVRAFQQLGFR